MNRPVELSYDECRDLLASGSVGRVAVCTPSGPRILPVNYSVVEQSIVFRTTPYSVLGTYAWHTQLAFQVDELDHANKLGWSVVALGRGALVEDPDELAMIRSHWDPEPWAGGIRQLHIRLRWNELTGRRLTPGGAAVQGGASARETG